MTTVISSDNLRKLADELLARGANVIAPSLVRGRIEYARIASGSALAPDSDYVAPAMSLKEFLFPRTEPILRYAYGPGGKVTTESPDPAQEPLQVIIGARPCDAASLPILDKIFSWDYVDQFYFKRRERTTIVTIACAVAGPNCYCTSVGYGPEATPGSDVLLRRRADGCYNVETLTEKGGALIKAHAALFAEESNAGAVQIAELPASFPLGKIKPWLDNEFQGKLWDGLAAKCLGCGTCAFVCPTCHCFDIVDEGDTTGGCRRKNWDACAFCQFTRHGSGHNPRTRQDERYRQRVMHKFKYYVEKFGTASCVGCGRCTMLCPVDMNLKGVLETIAKEGGA